LKRRLFWLPLALAIVLALSFGSLWGHQVIAESMAHGGYTHALTTVQKDLRVARSAGMFPSEVRPFSDSVATIVATKAPSNGTFWATNRESFFDHQTSKLKAVDGSLHSKLQGLTRAARLSASTLLHAFAHEIHEGTRDGLAVSKYVTQYKNATSDSSLSTHLSQFRGITATVQPSVTAFQPVIAARSADIASEMAAVRHSAHWRQAAEAEVAARITSTHRDLDVLTAFHKAPGLQTWLDSATKLAHSQTKIRSIVVAASDIGAVDVTTRAAIRKYAPAKWIYVSTENETISWYERGKRVGISLCTTGNPDLPTVLGHFTIFAKFSPFTFVSPEPKSSPDYYPPSPVSFAMEFQSAGYYIHDAPWRSAYGPGTDGPGQPGTNYGGTHGCVNVPYDVAAFLFGWAPMGTPVIVV
jgi:lipoprotein-anchoring transpeptidase ErfK/SrfK